MGLRLRAATAADVEPITALVQAEARRAGRTSMHLVTHETMTENRALYGRIGFAEVERRPVGRGALVQMRKPLG